MNRLVVIKGAGDIATGIAHRLFRSGFSIVMTELPEPTAIRRTVAFAEAVFSQKVTVEGVTAVKALETEAVRIAGDGLIPVVVDEAAGNLKIWKPWAVVDATLAKRNTGTAINQAAVVIGVGPGFTAGMDVHAVVETKRGHYLGRVITQGPAFADTGIPGDIGGYTKERILRAPCAGVFQAVCRITDSVQAGQLVATVNKQPIVAEIDGVLRGLLKDGITVEEGLKIGDIDPRCVPKHCFTISDKARAVGGGVLEALLLLGCRQGGLYDTITTSSRITGKRQECPMDYPH